MNAQKPQEPQVKDQQPKRKLVIEPLEERQAPNVCWGE